MNRREPTVEEKQLREMQINSRYALLKAIEAPKRETTAVCIPTGDGRIEMVCAQGLMDSIPLWSGLISLPHCSHVDLARNLLINNFMASPFDWCVMIDSDIGFRGDDFRYLTETNDYAVRAPYSKKDDSGDAIDVGLGFALVHRTVFDVLRATLCLQADHHSIQFTQYFLSGTLGTQGGTWMGEDACFWLLCQEIGVKPRIETRTRLEHIGKISNRIEQFRSF